MIFHSLAENGLAGTLLLLSIFAGAALHLEGPKDHTGQSLLCGCLGSPLSTFSCKCIPGAM